MQRTEDPGMGLVRMANSFLGGATPLARRNGVGPSSINVEGRGMLSGWSSTTLGPV